MNENKNNKILIAVVVLLSVIILALAIIIGAFIISDSQKKTSENTVVETSAPETTILETTTPEPTTEEPTTPEPTTAGLDMSQFKKGIYTENGQAEDSVWSDGGVQVEITDISKKNVSFTYAVISSPPANRIAEVEVANAKITNGKAQFTFDDDGWFNRGKGYIKFLENGQIEIKTEITRRDSMAMWDIGDLKHTLTYVD